MTEKTCEEVGAHSWDFPGDMEQETMDGFVLTICCSKCGITVTGEMIKNDDSNDFLDDENFDDVDYEPGDTD
jgi:hypothetical protein